MAIINEYGNSPGGFGGQTTGPNVYGGGLTPPNSPPAMNPFGIGVPGSANTQFADSLRNAPPAQTPPQSRGWQQGDDPGYDYNPAADMAAVRAQTERDRIAAMQSMYQNNPNLVNSALLMRASTGQNPGNINTPINAQQVANDHFSNPAFGGLFTNGGALSGMLNNSVHGFQNILNQIPTGAQIASSSDSKFGTTPSGGAVHIDPRNWAVTNAYGMSQNPQSNYNPTPQNPPQTITNPGSTNPYAPRNMNPPPVGQGNPMSNPGMQGGQPIQQNPQMMLMGLLQALMSGQGHTRTGDQWQLGQMGGQRATPNWSANNLSHGTEQWGSRLSNQQPQMVVDPVEQMQTPRFSAYGGNPVYGRTPSLSEIYNSQPPDAIRPQTQNPAMGMFSNAMGMQMNPFMQMLFGGMGGGGSQARTGELRTGQQASMPQFLQYLMGR